MKDPMNYRKAKGIVLLSKYLPDITPFTSIDIVSSLDEWEAIKGKYGSFAAYRVDRPIGGKPMANAAAGTDGFLSEVPGLIKKINQQSPDGVVLIMSTRQSFCPRYLYDGGFNTLFILGKEVIIEFVGKAFDGHELTQGIACHERYFIPWDEAPFMEDKTDLMRSGAVIKEFVSPSDYYRQRVQRVDFLTNDCRYDWQLVEQNVPQEHSPLKDRLVRSFLHDILFKLLAQEDQLAKDGLRQFGVQGNFVYGEAQPWEIFRAERWF